MTSFDTTASIFHFCSNSSGSVLTSLRSGSVDPRSEDETSLRSGVADSRSGEVTSPRSVSMAGPAAGGVPTVFILLPQLCAAAFGTSTGRVRSGDAQLSFAVFVERTIALTEMESSTNDLDQVGDYFQRKVLFFVDEDPKTFDKLSVRKTIKGMHCRPWPYE